MSKLAVIVLLVALSLLVFFVAGCVGQKEAASPPKLPEGEEGIPSPPPMPSGLPEGGEGPPQIPSTV
jgi:hypothetical protein